MPPTIQSASKDRDRKRGGEKRYSFHNVFSWFCFQQQCHMRVCMERGGGAGVWNSLSVKI